MKTHIITTNKLQFILTSKPCSKLCSCISKLCSYISSYLFLFHTTCSVPVSPVTCSCSLPPAPMLLYCLVKPTIWTLVTPLNRSKPPGLDNIATVHGLQFQQCEDYSADSSATSVLELQRSSASSSATSVLGLQRSSAIPVLGLQRYSAKTTILRTWTTVQCIHGLQCKDHNAAGDLQCSRGFAV